MSKNNTKEESGFGVVGILLVVTVIFLVGGVGFGVYKKRAITKNDAAIGSAPTSSTLGKSAGVQPAAKTRPSFTITEWNVKVAFDDADKVTYKMITDGQGKQYANLYLKDDVATVCQSLGAWFSRLVDDSDTGNHYAYQFSGHPETCTDDPGGANGNINQLLQKIANDELGKGKYKITEL